MISPDNKISYETTVIKSGGYYRERLNRLIEWNRMPWNKLAHLLTINVWRRWNCRIVRKNNLQ